MRVAYIGVWLAIAEGLRRKFTDMAPRDNVAARHLGEIEAREAQHKAIDAMLIRKAGEYGFVTDAEGRGFGTSTRIGTSSATRTSSARHGS